MVAVQNVLAAVRADETVAGVADILEPGLGCRHTSPCRRSGCWKFRRCRRGQTCSRNRVPPGSCDKRRAEAVPSSRVRWHCALDRVQVAPLQAAKPWQAKLGLQPMTELNLQRKQAPGWGLVRLPEL